MRVAVTGATGRMGREVRRAIRARDDTEIAFAASREPSANRELSASSDRIGELDDESELGALLDSRSPDIVVDFTAPEATTRYAVACAEVGVPLVTGTTGFDDDGRATLREAGESVPVLHGANFSRGVQALLSAVESAVRALPEYDVEVTETHHSGKVDAPSGTANVLLERIEDARSSEVGGDVADARGERVHGRVGDQPRREGEIGVHARRAGNVTGEHEALLAGNGEALELTHRAGDRGVFAAGALDAASWLAEQQAGFYRFEEVAAEL